MAYNTSEDWNFCPENCSELYVDYDYSDCTNCTVETIQFSTEFQAVIYLMYNIVFVAAVLGNLLVCYVVFSTSRMRTVTNYMIANLAVGDLLMAVLCVPFSYISVLLQHWPFGELLCRIVSPAQAVCVFVSAYTLVALAGDRYMAILYPLKPRLRRSQAVVVIGLVWVVALITAAPIAVFTRLELDEQRGLPLCEEVSCSFTLFSGYQLLSQIQHGLLLLLTVNILSKNHTFSSSNPIMDLRDASITYLSYSPRFMKKM